MIYDFIVVEILIRIVLFDSNVDPTMWNDETEEEFVNDSMNGVDFNPPDPDGPIPAALRGEEESHIYEHYSFNKGYSPMLPITQYQQDIVNTIETNSVCVIHG